MESQCPEGDRFSPSREDDADLWQFLEGLSEHGTDPGSYEGSNSRDTASNAGARGRTRSLPHRPKTRPSIGLSRAGTQAIDMAAVKFYRNQSAFGQGSSPIQAQLSNLLPATDTSSSISAGAMHAATYPPHATAPYLQYGGLAWGYGSPAAPVNIPARQTSSQDRALSSVRSASAPIFRGIPISLQGAPCLLDWTSIPFHPQLLPVSLYVCFLVLSSMHGSVKMVSHLKVTQATQKCCQKRSCN